VYSYANAQRIGGHNVKRRSVAIAIGVVSVCGSLGVRPALSQATTSSPAPSANTTQNVPSSLPTTTLRGGPNYLDNFPKSITFTDGRTGTLLPEQEIPVGNWQLVSYQLLTQWGTSTKGAARMVLDRKTAPSFSINYATTFDSRPGPFYRTSLGCLDNYFAEPFQGQPETLQYDPTAGRVLWLEGQLVGHICKFERKGSALTVFITSSANADPGSIIATLTFIKLR
jgi:hypothetical protein